MESLPPIETISAKTDIAAFMRTGVPETLKHAALRRAWSSDPVIRDFVGLNENYWDAAGPDGIPGFGDLDPNLDVRRMVSELFGETPRQDAQPEPEADRVAEFLLCQFKTEPTPPRRQRRRRHHLRMFRRATKMLQRTKSRQSPRRRKNLHGGTAAQCHSKIQKMKDGYSLKLLTFLAMGR